MQKMLRQPETSSNRKQISVTPSDFSGGIFLSIIQYKAGTGKDKNYEKYI
jgi:hypothetical protein